MRVNIYAEEMTDRIEIIGKEIEGHTYTGLRIYLELPATVGGVQHQGPFMHRPGDDDSSAVTFWGKKDLRATLVKAIEALDAHYDASAHRALIEAMTMSATHTDDQLRRWVGGMGGTPVRWLSWDDMGRCQAFTTMRRPFRSSMGEPYHPGAAATIFLSAVDDPRRAGEDLCITEDHE